MVPSYLRSSGVEAGSAFRSWCDVPFLAVSLVFLSLAAASKHIGPHLNLSNPRVLYGVHHLPSALCWCALISAVAAIYLPMLRRTANNFTTRFALISLYAAGSLLWLPIVQASRFSGDDWFLASAATIRQSLAVRPWLAWYALDTMDGNFRPLGTVLYLNFGLPVFGFYAGFLVCMIAATLLYFLARRVGAPPTVALYAALIFVSRDLLYGPVAWLCSLGDVLVLAAGAACVLLLLHSLDLSPGRAVLCHVAAFACFVLALLSKQSAYCIPFLALLALTLRPGQERPANTVKQWGAALFTTGVYLAATIGIQHHALHLSGSFAYPYPVAFDAGGIEYLLRCVLWFFAPLDQAVVRGFLKLENTLGAAILALLTWMTWRRRQSLGMAPRAFVFCSAAAFVSIALFLFLPSRRVPYYADFATLWASIPVAALLAGSKRITNPALGSGAVVALVVLGGFSLQLKRTALLPSGTYLGGTYGMDRQAAQFAALRQKLHDHPQASTVIIYDDSADTQYPAMIGTLSSAVKTVYVYRARTDQWLVNSLHGNIPRDTPDSWTDVSAFHWTTPLSSAPSLAPNDQVLIVP